MRFILIISAVLAAYLVTSSPISQELMANNYPDIVVRVERSEDQVKGGIRRLELGLRKGEYICGNKVCKLKPGEKPPCPVCQYPV